MLYTHTSAIYLNQEMQLVEWLHLSTMYDKFARCTTLCSVPKAWVAMVIGQYNLLPVCHASPRMKFPAVICVPETIKPQKFDITQPHFFLSILPKNTIVVKINKKASNAPQNM
jgi:hypothetical protein